MSVSVETHGGGGAMERETEVQEVSMNLPEENNFFSTDSPVDGMEHKTRVFLISYHPDECASLRTILKSLECGDCAQ